MPRLNSPAVWPKLLSNEVFGLERLMDNCISNKVWVLNEFKKSSKKERWFKDDL